MSTEHKTILAELERTSTPQIPAKPPLPYSQISYFECLEKLDMGHRWKPQELDIFLQFFRESDLEKVDEMQAALSDIGFSRTKVNLISLYLKNKNFLTFNKQATGDILEAIMADHYDHLESLQLHEPPQKVQPVVVEPTVATTIISQQQPLQQSSQQHQQPGPKRKNTPLNQIDTEPKKQKKKRITDTHPLVQSEQAHLLLPPLSTVSNRSRKAIAPFNGRFAVPLPNDLETRLTYLCDLSKQCRGRNHKRVKKAVQQQHEHLNEKHYQWIENEFFYSSIDKSYFQLNDFKDVLGQVGLQNVGKLKRSDWNVLRRAIGKPRRFSSTFVLNEMKKLQEFRGAAREVLSNTSGGNGNTNGNSSTNHSQQQSSLRVLQMLPQHLSQTITKIQPYKIGSPVVCIHPDCKHFHPGSILTTSGGDTVTVRFLTNELGVQKIHDTRIAPLLNQSYKSDSHHSATEETNKSNHQNHVNESAKRNGTSAAAAAAAAAAANSASAAHTNNDEHMYYQERQTPQSTILQDLDYYSMAFLIKLLDRKTLLINELKEYNNQAASRDSLDEAFYQKYGWTGIQINLIDNALKHVIARFRLRGLNHYSQQQIAENFNKILRVPLNSIQRELEENPQDQAILQEIKNIKEKNSDEKIASTVKVMITKNEQKLINQREEGYAKSLEENFYSTGYGNLLNIVYNCMGILQTLQTQGDINITQNTFLNSLASGVYTENPEQFLEINDVIQDILQKHKDNGSASHNMNANSMNGIHNGVLIDAAAQLLKVKQENKATMTMQMDTEA